MKKIDIISVARRKAARRGIKQEWIEDALKNPSQVVAGYGDRKVAHKKIMIGKKEYLLRVVYEETEEFCIVVTTYLTSQIDRYWKENDT